MNVQPGQIVLVDTNVIIEAHRTACWPALANSFKLVTVEKCYEESQTGHQNRSSEEIINPQNLRASLSQIINITDVEEANFRISYSDNFALDIGELHLLAHSLSRTDAWLLNSPDKALIRFAHNNQLADRLISLGAMVKRINAHIRHPLKNHYTEEWLTQFKTQLLLGVTR